MVCISNSKSKQENFRVSMLKDFWHLYFVLFRRRGLIFCTMRTRSPKGQTTRTDGLCPLPSPSSNLFAWRCRVCTLTCTFVYHASYIVTHGDQSLRTDWWIRDTYLEHFVTNFSFIDMKYSFSFYRKFVTVVDFTMQDALTNQCFKLCCRLINILAYFLLVKWHIS